MIYSFNNDYSEGAHPRILEAIKNASSDQHTGYSLDSHTEHAKALIKQAFDRAFEKYDVILGPTAPTTAPRLGESLKDPLQMYLGDIYTVSVNLAGLPGMSVPYGIDDKGLPIGVQFIGDAFQENKVIRAGYALEQTREWQMPDTKKGGR